MEEKLLVIKHNQMGSHVDMAMYIRTKNGLVLLTEMLVAYDIWEDTKEEINAEYINLDKPTQ